MYVYNFNFGEILPYFGHKKDTDLYITLYKPASFSLVLTDARSKKTHSTEKQYFVVEA